jgi:hypothetical protein
MSNKNGHKENLWKKAMPCLSLTVMWYTYQWSADGEILEPERLRKQARQEIEKIGERNEHDD